MTTSARSERSRLRRTEIVEAARDVFSAKGYRNGSLADIAERVGITHQGVLHHFGSKEQLLVEVLRERDEAERTGRPSGVAFLHHVLETVERNTHRAGIVQAYTVLSAESVTEEHPAQNWFRTRFTDLRSELATALETTVGPDAGVASEEFRRAAAVLVATMDGLQVQWLLEPAAVDMPAIVTDLFNTLLTSWGAPPLPPPAPTG
jgi:AcrR family transcriptional regulator